MAALTVQNSAALSDAQLTWDRMITAKGGRERLRSVHTLAWSSDDSRQTSRAFGGVRYEFVENYPDRFWAWEDYRPGSLGYAVEVWNAQKKTHWTASNGGRSTQLPWRGDSEAFRLRRAHEHQVLFLLESASLRPVPRSVSGNVLKIEVPGFLSVQITVDQNSSLPTVISVVPDLGESGSAPQRVHREYHILGYEEVDGIRLPARIAELGELSFVINPKVDPQLFQTPPDAVTDRGHWKKFLAR